MSELLDIQKLHMGLLQEFPDAVVRGDKSGTIDVSLVTPEGLPVRVGWYDHSHKFGFAHRYEIETYPKNSTNTAHHLQLEQPAVQHTFAGVLLERDYYAYLQGDAPTPKTLQHEPLSAEELDQRCRELVLGTFVINAEIGLRHDALTKPSRNDLSLLRAFGYEIVRDENVLGEIDEATLDRYAALELPASTSDQLAY